MGLKPSIVTLELHATLGVQLDHKCNTVVHRISGAVLEVLLPVIKEIKSDLNHLNELFSNLSDTVSDLNGTVEELKSKMYPSPDAIANAVLLKLLPYMNDLEETLVETVEKSENNFNDGMECIKEDLVNINGTVAKIWDATPEPPKEYTCGGTGGWRRVVYLNMTDDNTKCPTGWNLTNHSNSKTTCGRATPGRLQCDSVFFTVCGGCYTKVCGRITAYQYARPDAFESYIDRLAPTIDDAYVSGVSLTHGTPRQHIWTFACGVSETQYTNIARDICPCDADTEMDTPPFVGRDYFCESGLNEAPDYIGLYPDDPLWDGQGCTSSSTCCSFNNPPYFTKMLPSPTTDDIEIRLCELNDSRSRLEDTPIEFIELYVQ